MCWYVHRMSFKWFFLLVGSVCSCYCALTLERVDTLLCFVWGGGLGGEFGFAGGALLEVRRCAVGTGLDWLEVGLWRFGVSP